MHSPTVKCSCFDRDSLINNESLSDYLSSLEKVVTAAHMNRYRIRCFASYHYLLLLVYGASMATGGQ